ncbi:uncharacterized protein LOC120340406 [Styela clava]
MAEHSQEKLEEVFQNEIVSVFRDKSKFIEFARSKYGLRLKESDIEGIIAKQTISVEERNHRILMRWKEKRGRKATVSKIRSIVTRFQDKNKNITSSQPNAIIVFDFSTMSLYSYKPETKEWMQMQEMHKSMKEENTFTTVLVKDHIYALFHTRQVVRLKYSDLASKWTRVADLSDNYYWNPSAAELNGLLYVCGGLRDLKTVERYDPAVNQWVKIKQLNVGRISPSLIAVNDHLYCIGGSDSQLTNILSVERFNPRLDKWEICSQLLRGVTNASLAVQKGTMYVADNGVIQCFDIFANLWKMIDMERAWPFIVGYAVSILSIDNEIFAIGKTEENSHAMYKLNNSRTELEQVETIKDRTMLNETCIAVRL